MVSAEYSPYGGRLSFCCLSNTPFTGPDYMVWWGEMCSLPNNRWVRPHQMDCSVVGRNSPYGGRLYFCFVCRILPLRGPTIWSSGVSCARCLKIGGFDPTRWIVVLLSAEYSPYGGRLYGLVWSVLLVV